MQTRWRPPTADPKVAVEVTPLVAQQVAQQVTAQVTGEVTAEVAELPTVLSGESSREELMARIDLRHDEHFRLAYLRPAIEAGPIEPTVPGKPTSRLQKYRLTAKGNLWLKR